MTKPVFADASFYAAIVNQRDELHPRARQAAADLVGRVVTTEFVLIEVANFCHRGRQRAVFTQLFSRLRGDADTEIILASTELPQQGLELFSSRPDKEWSLTDCTSFVTMTKQGLSEALTADRHFEQAGFKALLS